MACALSCGPPVYERGLRERDVSGCIATRAPGEKNPSARQSRLAGWLVFPSLTSQAHASSLGHVTRPLRCICEALRDTRGPAWPNQGCKFLRFSIEISKIFFKKRCRPNPALAQTVSRPRYPLSYVLSHVDPLRTRGGCENATFRGAPRHERRAKKIHPRGRVVSRAGSRL